MTKKKKATSKKSKSKPVSRDPMDIVTGKLKVGRPTKYKKQFCKDLIDHMSQGYSYESFAATIDSHRGILYVWEEKHPDFKDAKKRAFEKCLEYWEKMGMAGTVGKLKGFQTPMWIFQMKNRFRWADRHEHAVDTEQNEIKLSYNPKE